MGTRIQILVIAAVGTLILLAGIRHIQLIEKEDSELSKEILQEGPQNQKNQKVRVVLLGDSFIEYLPIENNLPYNFTKHGTSGITAESILKIKLDAVIEDHPNLVLLSAGNNDVKLLRPSENIAEDLLGIYNYFEKRNIPCYIAKIFTRFYAKDGIHYSGTKNPEDYQNRCDQVHAILSKSLPPNKIIDFPGMNNPEWMSEDGVHLNAEGNKHFMQGFIDTVQNFLTSSGN